MKACHTCRYCRDVSGDAPCAACTAYDRWAPVIVPLDLKPGPIVPLTPTPEIRVQATVIDLRRSLDNQVSVRLGIASPGPYDFCVQAPRGVAAAFLPGDIVTLTITPGATT